MKPIPIICSIILMTCALVAGNTRHYPLNDVLKPDSITLNSNYLYVLEKSTIFVYSLKDMKLVNKFGQEGEGPKEFKTSPFGPPMLAIAYPDHLLVNSNNKISYFTVDGQFQKELRAPSFTVLTELSDHFVGGGTTQRDQEFFLSINLYGPAVNKIKELYVSDITVGPNATFNLPASTFDFAVYKDKIYAVTGKTECIIDVFDITGKQLSRIEKDIEKQPVTEQYKKETMTWFEKESTFKQFFQYIKQRISFKSNFPAVQQIFINNDKIYILTYKKKEDRTEVWVLDLAGKEIKRVNLPLARATPIMTPTLHAIENNHFYKIIENEEDELWEIYIEPI